MKSEKQEIIEELHSLEAPILAGVKAGEKVFELPDALDEQMLGAAMEQIAAGAEKTPVSISIREGMRREKLARSSVFLRIAAAVAAFGLFVQLSFQLTDNFFKDPCRNEEVLACLMSQTSGEEIFAFLEDVGMPDEEFWMGQEMITPEPTDWYELEMN